MEGKNDALDFPTHLDWLNTEKPLTMQDFRGRKEAMLR